MKSSFLLIVLGSLLSSPVFAKDNFLTAERQGDYKPALDDLTIAINDHNYNLIKIQPVDEGLRHYGYQTTNYKVIFFGNGNQFDRLVAAHPEAAVMLPLKILLYQQGNMIIASTPDLKMWKGAFGTDSTPIIEGWQRDVQNILRDFVRR